MDPVFEGIKRNYKSGQRVKIANLPEASNLNGLTGFIGGIASRNVVDTYIVILDPESVTSLNKRVQDQAKTLDVSTLSPVAAELFNQINDFGDYLAIAIPEYNSVAI